MPLSATSQRSKSWANLGCEIALAEIGDAEALTKAFEGTDGVFLMTPPNYDPQPGLPQTQANAVAVKKALLAAQPKQVVFLSTVGAHVAEPNLLNNSRMTEEMLGEPADSQCACFVRPGSWKTQRGM